jgi:phosphatidylserine/phosphatidylglycerophosphate/cardiolipin synthase-like enzyme
MFRPSTRLGSGARACLSTLAVGATVMLTVAGCKVTVSGTASSPTPAGSPATAAAPSAAPSASGGSPTGTLRSGTLVVEPSGGFSGVYSLIDGAKHSIDVTMYEFSDTTAERDLAAAAARGVQVRVILDQREKSTNDAAYRYFTDHKVGVVWSSASYEYTHQKTMVVDNSEAVIMTANLTSKYYATSRDFLVTDSGPADVSAIVAVFDADYAHRSVTPSDGSDLVWSPGSQDQLLAVINGATKSLRIYSEEMGDTTVEDALIAAAKRGVDVRVCGENADGEYDSDFSRLASAGVKISYFSSSTGFYIHGKVIEADYGTAHARAFIGSENFSSASLSRNRELGLITSSPAILSAIASTFATDFQNGKRVS